MEKDLLGVNSQDVAHLQDTSVNGQDVAHLQDVDNMSDEEFMEYLASVSDGEKPMEEQREEPAPEEKAAPEKKPYKSFDTKEAYQEEFNKHFSKRHKNHKEMEEVLALARESFGGGDDRTVLSRLKQDLIKNAAEEHGKTAAEYEEDIELRRKASLYDEMEKEQEERKQIMNRWIEDSEKIKAVNPDFDLEEALKNPEFRENLVSKGMSVAEAAYALLNGAKPQAPKRNILQNASSQTGSSTVRRDPSQMSDSEFRNYIAGIKGNI